MLDDMLSKKVHLFWRLLLGAFIAALGFAACKSSRKAHRGDDPECLYGPPPVRVDRQEIDPVKPLYGGPPVRVVREQPE